MNNIKLFLLLLQCPLLLSASRLCYALPDYSSTAGGSVTLDAATADTLNIYQSTSHAIVNWNNFNVGSNETVNVYQPSSSSILVNRVLSQDPTQILGNVNANGHVWIINGAGVLFGDDANVNVGGLIASTADIDDSNFMNGQYIFDQAGNAGSSIINYGSINAESGFVGLFASNITNAGTITANLGTIVLGATETYTLDFYGDGLINFALDDLEEDTVQTASYRTVNEGNVISDAGQIVMTVAQGNASVERLIENKWTGNIEAKSVGYNQNGQIVLGGGENGVDNNTTVLVSGSVSAKGSNAGERGGSIKVLGDQVAVLNDAVVDASGDSGGGLIYIGGANLGLGDTKTARATIIQDAYIKANGGNGEVIVWSNEYTNFYGTIEANGGGGFVETSSKDILSATGRVYAEDGEWLLDPGTITIRDDAGGAPDDSTLSGPVFDSASVNSVVTTEAIEAALMGADVTIYTSGGADGGIDITDQIEYIGASDRTLTFRAATGFWVTDADILSTGTGALNLIFWADFDRTSIATGDSIVYFNNVNVSTNGGDFILGGGADPYTEAAAGSWESVRFETVDINTDNALSAVDDGEIVINGTYTATSGGWNKYGVYIGYNSHLTTDNGNITLTGANIDAGSNASAGVWIDGSSILETNTGNIGLYGSNMSSNTATHGVRVWVGSQLIRHSTTTSGSITLEGTTPSAAHTSVNFGHTASFTFADTDISMIAHGGGIYHQGDILKTSGGDNVLSLVSDDDVLLDYLWPSTSITSTSGKMDIILTADADSDGTGDLSFDTFIFNTNGGDFSASGANLNMTNGTITANAGGTGNISLTADSLAMVGSTLSAAETVTIKPKSASRTMNIGTSTGQLDVSVAELAMISAANKLILGDSVSGVGDVLIDNIDLSAGGYDIEVYGGEITIDNNLTGGASVLLSSRGGNNINVNSVITAVGAGNSLVVNATGDFLNNYGVGALIPGAGRFLVYSADEDTVDTGGLTGDVILSETYMTHPPASVAGTNNTFIYASSPPVTPSTGGTNTSNSVIRIIPQSVFIGPNIPQTSVYSTPPNQIYVQTVDFNVDASNLTQSIMFLDGSQLNYSDMYVSLLDGYSLVLDNSGATYQ